jgi:thioredoxin reductase (NADPH)
MEKLVIVGTGCAGLTAAIYAARGNLSPLVLEGRHPGGQLATTTLVENFPGFPAGIDGPELVLRMKEQAERFGARFRYAELTALEPRTGYQSLHLDDEEWVDTEALIIASGAAARWLGLPGEQALVGHGLTSCATCDGAFYREVPVAVVGGGDSACEEAIFLTRFASKVYLVHRRDSLRASRIMTERVLAHPKIEPVWDTAVTEYLPDAEGEMQAVRLVNLRTGATSELAVRCVFVAIGHEPNTKPFAGKLPLDAQGYLLKARGTATAIPGIFAAGDVSDTVYRQAITAAGDGCAAALDAERYLIEHEVPGRNGAAPADLALGYGGDGTAELPRERSAAINAA